MDRVELCCQCFFKKFVLVSVFQVSVLMEFKNFCRILETFCSAKFMVWKGRR